MAAKVRELRPDLAWDKGRAVQWLLDRLTSDPSAVPLYAGDDLTDEDALDTVYGTGVGIVVRPPLTAIGSRPPTSPSTAPMRCVTCWNTSTGALRAGKRT